MPNHCDYRMANRRNIRKRQFEANKSLRLFREYPSLFRYLNGEGANEDNLSGFEANEKYENNKIGEMFVKKKRNMIIPAINEKMNKASGSSSENSD